MQKATVLVAIFAILLSSTGCFIIKAEAPSRSNVKILPPDVPTEFSKRYQKWFAAWGIFQLTPSDMPERIIAEEKLVEVRVLTEDSVEDMISGIIFFIIFPVGIILPQTVVVEGNRAPIAPEDGGTAKQSP